MIWSGAAERGRAFHRAADGGDEDGVLASSVGRKEVDDVAVIEREPRRAETLCVGAQVEPAADQARLEIGEPVAAVAEGLEERVQVGQEEHGRARHAAQRLLETEIGRALADIAAPDLLQRVGLGAVGVGARLDPVDGVRVHVEIHEARRDVGGPAPRGVPERGGELARRVIGSPENSRVEPRAMMVSASARPAVGRGAGSATRAAGGRPSARRARGLAPSHAPRSRRRTPSSRTRRSAADSRPRTTRAGMTSGLMASTTGAAGASLPCPPTGASTSAPSFSPSRARSPLTSRSTKPVTTRAGRSSAFAAARRFDSMEPESQKRWR